MKNKRRLRLPLFALCLTVSSLHFSDKKPELHARSAVLMDGASGRILFGKEAEAPFPMASTTKIMTCIIALEEAARCKEGLGIVCTADKTAVSQQPVKLGMREGEEFYLKDLLYSLMLESHNDTAYCIAMGVGQRNKNAGGVEEFLDMMNEKAEEIGCTDTYFITPNGLDAAEEASGQIHHTTAKDLAKIMKYCICESPQKEMFLEITQTRHYSFSNRQGERTFQLSNHNALLDSMEGAISGKTGYTSGAGYCYAGALERGGRLFIIALLGSGWPPNKSFKWSDTKKLIQYGADNYAGLFISYEKFLLPDRHISSKLLAF